MCGRSIWIPGKRLLRGFRITVVSAFVLVLLGTAAAPALAGPALYPDLVTLPPSGLYMERNSAGRYLLRFANTAANKGGRLEIEVDSFGSTTIYQNVYDQNVGGNRVVRQQVHSDLIYHPQHNHFHFSGFAQYELLKKNSAGYFEVTHREGSKTTFCILDNTREYSNGPTWPTYTSCGAFKQGLSAGWGDTYFASLFDQWIDVGTTTLADGQYAVRSTADPDNRLFETDNFNNVGMKYFSIVNGQVRSIEGPLPLCKVEKAAGGTSATDAPTSATVGQAVRLSCTSFGVDETVDVYWGSVNTTAKATVTATSSGALAAFLEVPPSDLGVHYWIAKGRTSGRQAAALVNTIPSVTLSPERGEVNSKTTATVRGFSADEEVLIRFYKYGSVVGSTVVLVVSSSGSGEIELPVPVGPFGAHRIEAIGQDSGAKAEGSFITVPSIELSSDEVEVGDDVGVNLRGFASNESVTITLGPEKLEVAEFEASHSGSTSASSSEFTVPDVPTGTYQVTARGEISGISVETELEIDANGSSTEPTETPTSPPEPSSTPTESATPTQPPDDTETPANASPIAIAGDDQVIADADNSGSESVQLTGSDSSDPDGGQLTVVWTINDVPVVTELDPLIDLGVGTHSLVLTVTDEGGASASDSVVISVYAPDPPTPIPTATP